MAIWITGSRVLIGVLGVLALLVTVGNLVSSGASMDDPAMSGGLVVGGLAIASAILTTAKGPIRAIIVWLGVAAFVAVLGVLWRNLGEMQQRDVIVYVGIPTMIALIAVLGLAVGRWRAGPLGA